MTPVKPIGLMRLSLYVAGLVACLVLVVWWGPELGDRQTDAKSTGATASDRGSSSALSGDDEGGSDDDGVLDVEVGGKSPRVAPGDLVKNKSSASSPDSPDSEKTEASIVKREAANQANKMTGLRMRLLMEAAERALHSETPWSELAQVALAFRKLGDDDSARYWFKRASRLASDPDDPKTGSRAMRDVVKAMVSAGYYELAEGLIVRIPVESEQSRAKAELVTAYARKRKFEEARRMAQTLSGASACGLAFRSIAESEARYLTLDDALRTLSMISRSSDRDMALGRVAAIRAAMGDSAGAMTLINRISSTRQRDTAVARVAEAQARGGSVSIESLVGLIHDPMFRDETLRMLIIKEASRRNIDYSAASANRIETASERAKAYESLVLLQLNQGDFHGALDRARSLQDPGARTRALQAVAVAMVRDEGVRSARNVVLLIADQEMQEEAFRKVAQRAALVGQSQGALDTISYMDDPTERAMAFASVALTYARYGGDDRARVIVSDANRELIQIESERAQAKAKGIVAEVFAETGDAGAALRTAGEISNSGLRDLTYRKLALSFAKADSPDLAEESASKIERESSRETALDTVAQTLAGRVPATDAMRYVSRIDGYRQQVRFLLGVAGRKS